MTIYHVNIHSAAIMEDLARLESKGYKCWGCADVIRVDVPAENQQAAAQAIEVLGYAVDAVLA